MSTPYDSQQVKTILAERGAQVEAYLQHCLDAIPMQGRLKEAMYYSLLAGGKRLRPVLCLSTAALFGLSAEAVMPFAASLEMIHTYSLIHDDLPAMDDDDLRRGRPSCHKAFDEATAILAGDALLTDAFGCMASTVKDIASLRAYGEALGVTFQIVDDILDETADTATLGKPAGSDAEMGKTTYPSLMGLDRSRELAQEFAEKAVDSLSAFSGQDAAFLKGLALILVTRNK